VAISDSAKPQPVSGSTRSPVFGSDRVTATPRQGKEAHTHLPPFYLIEIKSS
jgi:hypothetical protein